jgi:OTT_1508-like deaminase
MIAWLSSFKDHEEDLVQLCRFAYGARATPYMKELKKRSGKTSALTVESNEANFLKLRHYIGRLGFHVKAAKTLVAAAKSFPAFFDDFEIEYLPSSKPVESPPPMDELTTLDGIVGRMLKNENTPKVPYYRDALNAMDTKLQIYQRLKNEYRNPAFLPRVHAELILLEHFYKSGNDFVDGDKYIGCSKPACYCCYHYISAHPGNFVRPASHNKTYLCWRPPDIVDDDAEGSGMKHRRDIINKMVEKIRIDVLEQIEKQSGRRRTHPDSTTGITASVAVAGPYGPSGSRLFTPNIRRESYLDF